MDIFIAKITNDNNDHCKTINDYVTKNKTEWMNDDDAKNNQSMNEQQHHLYYHRFLSSTTRNKSKTLVNVISPFPLNHTNITQITCHSLQTMKDLPASEFSVRGTLACVAIFFNRARVEEERL